MKNSKKVWSLILIIIIIICIIMGIVIFFSFNKSTKVSEWDIKIYEYWNNIYAGRRAHESRSILIDSQKCIGKATYIDETNEYKETKEFKISKKDINKILNLADKGSATNERNSYENYTVYEIKTNIKTTYVDAKQDTENLISNLFNK